MTAFFVPTLTSESQEEFYEAIVKGAEMESNGPVLPQRIFSLTYRHNGKTLVAQVGEQHSETRFTIFAILKHEKVFTIRTTKNGVFNFGDPHVVGLQDEFLDLIEFD
jgi:hypothetical protein